MRIAAIYDIHSNLPALEAVLDEIRREKVDQIIVGGDVVPGPMPRETIARLLEVDLPTQFITGNGDREIVAKMRGIETGTVPERFRHVMEWVADQLGPDEEKLLASWPKSVSVQIDGLGKVLFCHATPRNDTELFTRRTPESALLPVFKDVSEELVVCGHTHMQFDRPIGDKRVVNAGSVGLPSVNRARIGFSWAPTCSSATRLTISRKPASASGKPLIQRPNRWPRATSRARLPRRK